MKPILFNTEMVRALQDGTETVTRRVVKPQPKFAKMTLAGLMVSDNPITTDRGLVVTKNGYVITWNKMPYRPSDILYVRETWAMINGEYVFRADDETPEGWHLTAWHPSIHMPREAARIFLRVTDVRMERLQDINERGPLSAVSEGFTNDIDLRNGTGKSAAKHFTEYWDSTLKPKDRALYGWDANPWVWVIEFERISKEEALASEQAEAETEEPRSYINEEWTEHIRKRFERVE